MEKSTARALTIMALAVAPLMLYSQSGMARKVTKAAWTGSKYTSSDDNSDGNQQPYSCRGVKIADNQGLASCQAVVGRKYTDSGGDEGQYFDNCIALYSQAVNATNSQSMIQSQVTAAQQAEQTAAQNYEKAVQRAYSDATQANKSQQQLINDQNQQIQTINQLLNGLADAQKQLSLDPSNGENQLLQAQNQIQQQITDMQKSISDTQKAASDAQKTYQQALHSLQNACYSKAMNSANSRMTSNGNRAQNNTYNVNFVQLQGNTAQGLQNQNNRFTSYLTQSCMNQLDNQNALQEAQTSYNNTISNLQRQLNTQNNQLQQLYKNLQEQTAIIQQQTQVTIVADMQKVQNAKSQINQLQANNLRQAAAEQQQVTIDQQKGQADAVLGQWAYPQFQAATNMVLELQQKYPGVVPGASVPNNSVISKVNMQQIINGAAAANALSSSQYQSDCPNSLDVSVDPNSTGDDGKVEE